MCTGCAFLHSLKDNEHMCRFQSSKLVRGNAGIRFYIGAPLIASNGHRLGMMCVYDTKPRKVDANIAQIVCNLAELAVRELEKNWALQVSRMGFCAVSCVAMLLSDHANCASSV
jgi:hypothetical protein